MNDFNQLDIESFFHNQWERISQNSTANQENPIAYVLGGQPGAGKSQLTYKLIDNVFKNNVVIINGDEFREGHPKFNELQEKFGRDASKYTGEFAGAIVRMSIEKAAQEKRNIIVEGTFRTAEAPNKTLGIFKDSGYKTGVAVMTTDKTTSWNSTVERYNKMKQAGLFARATPKEHHDLVIKNIPNTADEVYETGFADEFVVYSRKEKIWDKSKNNSPSSLINIEIHGK